MFELNNIHPTTSNIHSTSAATRNFRISTTTTSNIHSTSTTTSNIHSSPTTFGYFSCFYLKMSDSMFILNYLF
jgi:hypothetical protein